MLNFDLISWHRAGVRVVPDFVEPGSSRHLECAAALLAVYRSALDSGSSRSALDELTLPLIRGAFDPRFAAALNRLLAGRAKFQAAEPGVDYAAVRDEIFRRSFASLAGGETDCSRHRARVFAAAGGRDLYGDLPESERLTGIAEFSAAELLNRYNLALVQGLLLRSQTLKVTVPESEPAELRRLFKYLKFFRLLAEPRRCRDGGVELEISGPLALFGPTSKYALSLAAFFPAVVRMKRWRLEALVRLRRGQARLKLDESSRLVSHYRSFSGYVPEEIRMFHRHFAATVTAWRIVGDTPFIDGGGAELIFPDLSFASTASGVLRHLELFHRWHRVQLERRMELLNRRPGLNLLLGIDRSLADDAGWQELLRRFPGAAEHCFRFRDFPGVTTTLRLLERSLDFVADPPAGK